MLKYVLKKDGIKLNMNKSQIGERRMNRNRKPLGMLLSLIVVFSVLAIATVTASADDGVPFVVRSWNEQTNTVISETAYCTDYSSISSSSRNLSGWYVVKDSVNLSDRLIVSGEANIILCDGARLYCENGICVSKGNTLNIFCQKDGTGVLYCDADINDNAAIGADDQKGDCGTVIIHGGNITADTAAEGTDGAGIGGGDEGNGGLVVIYGGTVKAFGGKYAAGIGGGDADGKGGNGGTTIIYGGEVTANGGTDAAGIGGGEDGKGGIVEIWGGTVNANGGSNSAGIGGGEDNGGGTTTINGGTVNANGGRNGAGIGGGDDGNGGTITINGGTVNAKGGEKAAGIGGGCGSGVVGNIGFKGSGSGNITITGGTVTAEGDKNAAGIGSGFKGYVDEIQISGGEVNALSGGYAACIGSQYSLKGKITISGGNITTRFTRDSDRYAAAIGNGAPSGTMDTLASYSKMNGSITVSGGTITATGSSGAAIGSAYKTDMTGAIKISGGTVRVSSRSGAAIGSGYGSKCKGTITVTGGDIEAYVTDSESKAVGCGKTGKEDGTLELDGIRVVSGASKESAVPQPYKDRVKGCRMQYAKLDPCTEHSFSETAVSDSAETHSYRCVYCDFKDEEHTHPHDIEVVSWKWAEDYKSATVSVKCPTCGYADDITVSGNQINDKITDEQLDEHTFTATFTLNGKDYTDTVVRYRSVYIDPDNSEQHEVYYDRITSDTKELESGWYVANGKVSWSDRIICSGEVNLILNDGAELKAPKGISVNEGTSLTVWGESKGTGKLTVDSANNDFAGIGGDKDKTSGQITINGGTITSKGGIRAAGIGGGKQGTGNVTINGGTVDAEGGTYIYGLSSAYVIEDKAVQSGAGIGGGTLGEGVVTINGGSIKAKGGKAAAGIGGGKQGTGNVTINGGAVNATGGTETLYIAYPERHQAHILGGAGIGGGEKSAASLITVNGGDIFARGGGEAAGIGSGGFDINSSNNDLWSKGKVIINGGTVDAKGGTEAAGIGGGGGSRCEGLVTITGGTVIAAGGGNAAAIGGGMYNRGVVDITGGHITADSGGIGSGWDDGYHKAPKGSITLGYGDEGAAIYSSEYHNTDITLTKQFTDGTNTYEAKEYGADNEDTFKGKTIWSPGTTVVEWDNYNGEVLKRDLYKPGTMPVYTGREPAKAADDYYVNSFTGWTPEITEVTENASYKYTATYEKVPRIITPDNPYGKVTPNVEGAKQGETVTLKIAPEPDYQLKDLHAYTITEDKHSVPLTVLSGQGETGDEGYPKLVDGNINTKWYTPFTDSNYIICKTDKSVSMDAYALTTANDTQKFYGRNWKDWTIYGANFTSDSEAVPYAAEWEEITSVRNDYKLPKANFTQTDYVLSKPAKEYKYYMVIVTAKGGTDQYGDTIQMAEFTLYDKYRGEQVELSGSGYTRTFTMPDSPVSVDAEFERPVFVGYNLSLGGDIGLIYYLDITDKEAENNAVSFNWSYMVDGEFKDKSYTGELVKDEENGLYITACPVPAAEMIYGINASITINGNRFTDNYAVFRFADTIQTSEAFAKSYIENENAKGNDGEKRLEQLRTLMKTMLDYGAWAQVQFNRNPDTLINSEFVTDDPTSPYYYVPEVVDASMINTGSSNMKSDLADYGLEYQGSTIVYLSKTSMRHYYKVTDQAKFDAVKDEITFNGDKCGYVTKNDMIYFELQDISAPDLDTLYTLKIGTSEYKYSVLDYVKTCLTSDDSTESLKNLSKATYRYNKAADIFFGPQYNSKTQSSEGESMFSEAMKLLSSTVKSVLKGQASETPSGDEYETPLMKAKSKNTLTVKGKTAKVSYKKVSKKAVTVARKKALKVSKAKGKVTYKLVSAKKGKKNFKKYFKVNTKNGKVTVKKGLKKGTYKVRIKVTAKGNKDYKAKTLTRTATIKVK